MNNLGIVKYLLISGVISTLILSCNVSPNPQKRKYSGLAISYSNLSAFGVDSVCHVSLHGRNSNMDTVVYTGQTIFVSLQNNYFEIFASVSGISVKKEFNKDSTKLIMLQYQYWPCDLYRDSVVHAGTSTVDSIAINRMYSVDGGCFPRPKELDCFLVQ